MKMYPSITKDVRKDVYIYAFDKLDGSNMRAEWNSKKGFYKFGSRTELIDRTSPFNGAITLIQEKYSESLSKVFKDNKWSDALCFFEYWGPSSFAGSHNFEEKMDVTLIDVNPYKQGILTPDEFLKLFSHLDIPRVLYEGQVSVELFDAVKQSTLPGMTMEGVVCKGTNDKKTNMPIMFKIKSQAWLDKLKEHCKDNEALFNRLA
jgi:hypothetical protein